MRSISSIQNSETSKLTQKPDFYLGQGFLLQILILNVMMWTNSVHGKSAPDNLWLNPVKRFAEIVSLCEVHLAKIALVMPSSSSTNLFKSTHMKFLANLTRVTMLKKYLMLSYQQSLVNFASENLNHYSPYRFFFKKNGPTPASFSFISGLFKETIQFVQQINVKNVHPVCVAGIRTHDFSNMSRHPLPLEQGSSLTG